MSSAAHYGAAAIDEQLTREELIAELMELGAVRASLEALRKDYDALQRARSEAVGRADELSRELRSALTDLARERLRAGRSEQALRRLVSEITPCTDCDHPLCEAARTALDQTLLGGWLGSTTCLVAISASDAIGVGQTLRTLSAPGGIASANPCADALRRVGDALAAAAHPALAQRGAP